MGELELTPRLALIAGWVPQGARIADVGTDHAYLPVWLTLHGRVASAIAGDLRPGPLDRARERGPGRRSAAMAPGIRPWSISQMGRCP